MDGSWRIYPKTHRAPRDVPAHKIRIVLEAGSVAAAGIDLGVLEVLDRVQDADAVAHLGPDLLGPDWDPATAAANLVADPGRPIAAALLDQRVLAGVGNVYCNELCFLFGRLPTSAVDTVSDPLRLVSRARDMLWANRLRMSRTTTGNTRPGQRLWVYGRFGEPCRRCGARISRAGQSDAERVSYWCPSCQS
jgi:endonuclease-8